MAHMALGRGTGAPDVAVGLLGAFLGMPVVVSSPVSLDEPQDTVTEAAVLGRQVHSGPGSYGSRGDISHRVPTNAGPGRRRDGP